MDAPLQSTSEVAVVSDDPIVRNALLELLAREHVKAEGASPDEAADADAEVLVWDMGADARIAQLRIEEYEGTEADSFLRKADIVALVPRAAGPALNRLVEGGVRGLLTRETSGRALAAAVNAVRAGLLVVDPALSSPIVARRGEPLAEELTAREREVLQQLSLGLANKEIAQNMHISDHTVKFHVNAIMQKLGVTSRTEAVVRAARLGLVTL